MGKAISVKVDLSGVEKKLSPQAMRMGKQALAQQMMLDTTKYIPKKSGNLRASGYISNGGDTIVYSPPYARAQYYGPKKKGFVSEKQRKFFFANKDKLLAAKRKYTTPGTGTKWYDKAKAHPGNMVRWKKAFLKGAGIDTV